VDGTREKELADQFNVGGWPHLLMFRKVRPSFKKYTSFILQVPLFFKERRN
jgi:hypothetical protein